MPLPTPIADTSIFGSNAIDLQSRSAQLMERAFQQFAGINTRSASGQAASPQDRPVSGSEEAVAALRGEYFQPSASEPAGWGAQAAAPSSAAQASAKNWLTYTNQSATRSLPLNDKLVNAMSFLNDMGVRMEVFSGGQHDAETAAKLGTGRVGSVRHDHGESADVFFYRDNEMLNWANRDHLPIFEQIVKTARSRGITGFGAGDGYMRPGSMHIGFGAPAIWGAQGKAENAAPWLQALS